jgi:hypothetical protein
MKVAVSPLLSLANSKETSSRIFRVNIAVHGSCCEDCKFSDIPWLTSVGVKFTYRELIPSRITVSRQFTDLSSVICFVPDEIRDKQRILLGIFFLL